MSPATTTDPSKIPVVILAGGQGTRLRPLTFGVPKPLLSAGGEPILGTVLRRLQAQGFRQIYLALGYLADLILAYVGEGKRWELEIEASAEKERLGTAGPIRAITDKFDLHGQLLVMNADILTSARFDRFLAFHMQHASQLTVAVRRHRYQLPFGEIEQQKGRVVGIREKPVITFNVSAGIYVVEPEVARLIPRGQSFDMPDLIAKAVERNIRVLAYPLKERWLAVEEIHHLEAANSFWRARQP